MEGVKWRMVKKSAKALSNQLTQWSQLDAYDVIGFDVDYSLVRYNMDEATPMMVWCD